MTKHRADERAVFKSLEELRRFILVYASFRDAAEVGLRLDPPKPAAPRKESRER